MPGIRRWPAGCRLREKRDRCMSTLVFGHRNPDTDAIEGIMFPGVNLKFIPVHGLTGTNKAYAGRASNMFIGVDAESDFDSLEVWYSKDDRKVKVAMEFKVGTQVAFPNEIAAIVL